jgi:hypothetical protein
MHHAHVSAAQLSVELLRRFVAADLGTIESPGDNQLEVLSGNTALIVSGEVPDADIHAHGTTLNGTLYTGDVQGPVDVPGGYIIHGSNIVHF